MTHHKTALITDSTCDIPDELIARYDIEVVPSFIIFGTEEYRDHVDMRPEEFYRRLESDLRHPTTAHPTPAHFLTRFREAHARGATEIVVITVSGAMSGTIGSAREAAQQAPIPVHVIDSKGPTMSLGWQVLAAVRARVTGGDAAAMVAAADDARSRMVQFVSLDTLEYLYKGGRIGNATRLIGTLLQIKPLVLIDHNSGLVEEAGHSRTRKRAIDSLYEGFFRALDVSKRMHIAVLHGAALADAQALAERIRAEFNPIELLINTTGPVLGVHTGPRAVALCGYTEA